MQTRFGLAKRIFYRFDARCRLTKELFSVVMRSGGITTNRKKHDTSGEYSHECDKFSRWSINKGFAKKDR